MKIGKIDVRIPFVLLTLFCLTAHKTMSAESALSERFSLYYIPDQSIVTLDRFLSDNTPPLAKNIIMTPEKPTPNDEVMISADIVNDPTNTENKPLYAYLYYSTDEGKTWNEIEMEQDAKNPTRWYGAVPPTGKAGEFPFFFSAEDEGGNYLLELPVTAIKWTDKEPPELFGKITDKNDEEYIVSNDLDILEAKIGYDGNALYFGMKVEGEISSGTVSPFALNVYSVGIYYPQQTRKGSVRADFVLEHSPDAEFLHFPIVGLLDIDKKLSEVTTADARYYADDGWLYMRFKQSALKDKKFDKLRVIFGTAIATEHTPLTLKPMDRTGFINIVRVDRAFEVK